MGATRDSGIDVLCTHLCTMCARGKNKFGGLKILSYICNLKTKDMTNKETKLMVIENFIDWYTTDDTERESMKINAKTYVDEDWVDEVQSRIDEVLIPVGRNYTIDKLEVIQIPKTQLSQTLINELKDRETFIDTDNLLDEVMYSSDVFETILGEQFEYFGKQNLIRVGKEHQVLVDELMVLDEICKNSQYVMLTSI